MLPAAPAVAAQSCEEAAPRYVDQNSYALERFAVGRAWQITTGSDVTVAVVDSGVAADNAHLREAVRPGHSAMAGDPDPTGRTDLWGHGTAVAGLIGARPVEGSAVYGVAPSSTILPVRVFVAERDGSYVPPEDQLPSVSRMAEGIAWAARNGADVINVSMSTRSDDPALRAAVREAVRRDIVVVASGGNRDNESEDDGPRYPAALPGVVGVAASDENDQVTDHSIHGEHIDLFAPGQNVLAAYKLGGDCLIGQEYPYSSYATGYVSGVAALLRARYPDESAEKIVYRMTASADRPRRDERDDIRGWGLVQPLEALTMTIDPSRPGPRAPGAQAPSGGVADTGLPAIRSSRPDPLAPAREQMLWWLMFGAGAVTLAFVLRPLVVVAQRRRRGDGPLRRP
jgi:type VII secretion-associated serine protease mycosin